MNTEEPKSVAFGGLTQGFDAGKIVGHEVVSTESQWDFAVEMHSVGVFQRNLLEERILALQLPHGRVPIFVGFHGQEKVWLNVLDEFDKPLVVGVELENIGRDHAQGAGLVRIRLSRGNAIERRITDENRAVVEST